MIKTWSVDRGNPLVGGRWDIVIGHLLFLGTPQMPLYVCAKIYMHRFANMPNMTIRIPDDLKRAIDNHPEINWSEVARQSMWEYVHTMEVADEIASRSELTPEAAEELSRKLKSDIAEHYR